MEQEKSKLLDVKKIPEEKILDRAYQLGFDYEKTRYFCAQCVVFTLGEVFGIKDEGILRAAYPFSGGLGSTTEGTCGALSGGAMILGYLYGRSKKEFYENISDRKALYLTKLLCEKFIQEYGSCKCKDIQMKLFGRSFDFWAVSYTHLTLPTN